MLGLLFKRLPGLLHFGVLALDFRVLFGQQLGLLLQFEIGLLQLLLPALELLRQRLGLFEEILGAGIGLDGIKHNPDRLH